MSTEQLLGLLQGARGSSCSLCKGTAATWGQLSSPVQQDVLVPIQRKGYLPSLHTSGGKLMQDNCAVMLVWQMILDYYRSSLYVCEMHNQAFCITNQQVWVCGSANVVWRVLAIHRVVQVAPHPLSGCNLTGGNKIIQMLRNSVLFMEV